MSESILLARVSIPNIFFIFKIYTHVLLGCDAKCAFCYCGLSQKKV